MSWFKSNEIKSSTLFSISAVPHFFHIRREKKDFTVLILLFFFYFFNINIIFCVSCLVEAERSRGISKYDLSSYFYANIDKYIYMQTVSIHSV